MLHQQRNQHARLIPVELYMSDKIIHLTDDSFDTDVLKADGAILVDFWAEWCGPCKMIAPILDEIADEYQGKLTVAKLTNSVREASPKDSSRKTTSFTRITATTPPRHSV